MGDHVDPICPRPLADVDEKLLEVWLAVWPKYRTGFYSKCLRVRHELRKLIRRPTLRHVTRQIDWSLTSGLNPAVMELPNLVVSNGFEFLTLRGLVWFSFGPCESWILPGSVNSMWWSGGAT